MRFLKLPIVNYDFGERPFITVDFDLDKVNYYFNYVPYEGHPGMGTTMVLQGEKYVQVKMTYEEFDKLIKGDSSDKVLTTFDEFLQYTLENCDSKGRQYRKDVENKFDAVAKAGLIPEEMTLAEWFYRLHKEGKI